ncbi:sporulation related protein [Luteibacter rhizovicinus]|uniref:Sporulation related protein n=1 Tax=Luteibacter rhizovicinus TaxID=242606 RepID=A0A4R3YTQ4_9GAMM|nr:SPOR domain-containing protein [Luteibacter rhizovicinus]TCV95812.1 sporulation related protein [Luteibacter rhizovicinus]
MLPRLLFVLLIALNIAVAAWLWLGDSGVHAVDPTDKGVPKLRLLAELPAPAMSIAAPARPVALVTPASSSPAAPASAAPVPVQSVATAPSPPPAPASSAGESTRRSYRCLALGPFSNQADMRAARTALSPRTARMRSRQEQTSQSRGWRVFLPAYATREQALAEARKLEAKGVKDYFVVTSGDLQNTVALGLFHDPANARKRRDEVAVQGFPAKMSERTETTPVWWLDLVVADDANFDWKRSVRTPGIATRSTGCF